MTHPVTANAFAVPPYLSRFCEQVEFHSGDVVHREGHRYQQMYLVTEGSLDCYSECEDIEMTSLGAGSAIGDVGYLGGYRARATVIARTKVRTLVITDTTFGKVDNEDRSAAVHFRKFLATLRTERETPNYSLATLSAEAEGKGNIKVLLSCDENMLLQAKKLRYSVDCDELGRDPLEADHARKIITDPLDEFGHTFIAIERGEVIGTLRMNLAREGRLGLIEDLYGMPSSVNHPAKTAVCTQFYIKKSRRTTPAFLQLGGAWLQDAMSRDVLDCFIAVVPSLTAPCKLLGCTAVLLLWQGTLRTDGA